MSKQQWYITLNDHKEDFNENPRTRLTNPTYSEIGQIISDRIVLETDVGKFKEYETFEEMKDKLSDVEILQEFLKLCRQSWHHDPWNTDFHYWHLLTVHCDEILTFEKSH